MNFKDELKTTSANLAQYRKLESEGAAGFTAMHKAAMKEGALSTKEKELIALSIGIVRQCADCIGFHVKAAMEAGASKEEIAEAISVCVMMGGGPAYMYGARALEAYDQLSAE